MNKFTRRGFFGLLLAAAAWRPRRKWRYLVEYKHAFRPEPGGHIIPIFYERKVKD